MTLQSKRLREFRAGQEMLEEIKKVREKAYAIHYSSENYLAPHGRTPRITSITIRNLQSGQTKSFSIHLQAQFMNLDFKNLTVNDYDNLERRMLSSFFSFVKSNPQSRWLHWNMRNPNFGFEAINNRFRILGGREIQIPDEYKFDMPLILSKIYTSNFEEKGNSMRMINLAIRNNLFFNDALPGAEEAIAFDNKEFLKIYVSTLNKVDIMANIYNLLEIGDLKVRPSRVEIYGLTIAGIFEIIKETWWLLVIWALLAYIAGAATEPIVQRFFGTN